MIKLDMLQSRKVTDKIYDFFFFSLVLSLFLFSYPLSFSFILSLFLFSFYLCVSLLLLSLFPSFHPYLPYLSFFSFFSFLLLKRYCEDHS